MVPDQLASKRRTGNLVPSCDYKSRCWLLVAGCWWLVAGRCGLRGMVLVAGLYAQGAALVSMPQFLDSRL
jgi:hypothetical protein